MFSWLFSVIGICLGNTLWLGGVILIGVGIWARRVSPKSIKKTVNVLSSMTRGQPRGLVLKLQGLIEPVDRRREFGFRMFIIGAVLIAVGCTFIGNCTG